MSAEQTYKTGQDTRTETKRKCPYCHDTVYSRGLYAHVMNSADEQHGEYRSVPEGFNPREAEIVGEESVEVSTVEPEETETEAPNTLYLCTKCGGMFRGDMGYKVHLAKVAGDDVHPQDLDIDDGEYAKIPADEDYEPTIPEEKVSQIEEREVGVEAETEEEAIEKAHEATTETEQVPLSALHELADRFDGKGEAYQSAEDDVEEVIARYA